MHSSSSSSVSRHASGKLHKRSDSASSLAANQINARVTSPVQDEYTLGQRQPSLRSSNKIKPYLRKMSLRDDGDDQGRLDLSRPSADNDTLAGLGIRDFSNGSRSVSDVSFQTTAVRRASSTHTRAISGASQMSTASAPLRPTQPFVHPMRQNQRPYTPPSAISYNTIVHPEEEAEESSDIIANEMHLSDTRDSWRQHRSTSTSSVPRLQQADVSYTHSTASLTKLANASQSNVSTKSDKSAKEKSGRPRRNTDRSFDATSPSSRTSFDKAFSFLSRSTELQEDPAARAASIRAARRAFEEKEAAKDRKLAKEQIKRRDTEEKQRAKKEDKQRRKSETSDRHRRSRSDSGNTAIINEKVPGKEYSNFAPVHNLSLPVHGQHVPAAPTRANADLSKTKVAKGGWMRFMAWTRTRLLSCGA